MARDSGVRRAGLAVSAVPPADLVILDKNPLKVDPMAIKGIKIVETIKEGKSIYRRQAHRQ